MKKRLVATTSTSCLDYFEHNQDIRTIRIKIDINGQLLSDGDGITAENFYKMMEDDEKLVFKTSQPSIGELVEMFEGFVKEGFEELIVTTISAKLSGTINAIRQAAALVEDLNVIVFDTKTVCFNEGCFALKAADMIIEGKETEEIISTLEHMRDNNKIFFAVSELDQLVKNGRLSGASGFLGKLFQIKPILELMPDGTIQAVEKIRTTKKALVGACERLNNYIKGHDYYAYIVCTGPTLIPFLEEELKKTCGLENLDKSFCSPVVGCHVGAQAIGIGVFLKD